MENILLYNIINYKGVDRPTPPYGDPGTLLGDLWLKWVEASDEIYVPYISKLEDALELQADFKQAGYNYEVIECIDVTLQDATSPFPFLGYDIVSGSSISLLYEYEILYQSEEAIQEDYPIRVLTQKYFVQRRNPYGLLSDYSEAKLLFEIEKIIAKDQPDLDAQHIEECKILKISLVASAE